MDSPYLSFPELPDGYVWTYGGVGRKQDEDHYLTDIDLFLGTAETRAEDKDMMYELADEHNNLVGWVVVSGNPPRMQERMPGTSRHTYEILVASAQEGVDVLAARVWLGMTGVPDA